MNDGLGLGLGYGISDKVNLKIRYERLSSDGSTNFVAFGPKISLKKDRIAAALPVWSYFSEGESLWGISPTMLFGLLPPSKTFETTIGLRGDINFEEETDSFQMSIHMLSSPSPVTAVHMQSIFEARSLPMIRRCDYSSTQTYSQHP